MYLFKETEKKKKSMERCKIYIFLMAGILLVQPVWHTKEMTGEYPGYRT